MACVFVCVWRSVIGLLQIQSFYLDFPRLGSKEKTWQAKKYILATTLWVTAVCLAIFATLLHYTEHDNQEKVETMTMGERFVSVPHGLFYTLVHLTGDYPLFQYVRKQHLFVSRPTCFPHSPCACRTCADV